LGGPPVILQVPVVDESQVLPEAPVGGIIDDAVADEIERSLRLSGALRRLLGKENRAKAVGNKQVRIQFRGDAEKRRKQLKPRLLG